MGQQQIWREWLDEGQADLVRETYKLMKMVEARVAQEEKLNDYAFVVFPMAKAYEGMLKRWFFKLGLIDQKTYEGERFRVGKALNPDFPERIRGRWWLYGRVVERCGETVAVKLWRAWKEGRNRLFHYFSGQEQFISLSEAKEKVKLLEEAMRVAIACAR